MASPISRPNGTFCMTVALATIAAAAIPTAYCFQPSASIIKRTVRTEQATINTIARLFPNNDVDDISGDEIGGILGNRRTFLSKATSAAAAAAAPFLLSPSPANAGIDVSGLRVEGGAPSNSVVASQLKGISSSDSGTAASRVREIKQTTTSVADQQKAAAVTAGSRPALSAEELGSAATYARVTGVSSVQTIGLTKLNSRYSGYVESPSKKALPIQFDFPTDWLQLDRANGGLQYVDQRNGNKLYVFRAPLPPDTNLATVPKSFFDDAVFDSNGDLVRFGTVVGAHRTSRSTVTQADPNAAYLHRRLQLNYETVSGNGVQTIERRGLLDAYEIEGVAFMMLASANAVKFEKKDGAERATIDMIVDSFRVGS